MMAMCQLLTYRHFAYDTPAGLGGRNGGGLEVWNKSSNFAGSVVEDARVVISERNSATIL